MQKDKPKPSVLSVAFKNPLSPLSPGRSTLSASSDAVPTTPTRRGLMSLSTGFMSPPRATPPASTNATVAASPSSQFDNLDVSSSSTQVNPQSGSQMPRPASIPFSLGAAEGSSSSGAATNVAPPISVDLGFTGLPENLASTRVKVNMDEISLDIEGVRKLMSAGQWRSVPKLADRCIAATNDPELILEFKLCRVAALMKTKSYKNAYDEVLALGDFNDPSNCYETHPEIYGPEKKGSMVPWNMSVLKAELAHILNPTPSIDSLFSLLNNCKREIDRSKAQAVLAAMAAKSKGATTEDYDGKSSAPHKQQPGKEDDESLWQRREFQVSYIIISYLLIQREYPLAIQMLKGLHDANPQDYKISSMIGRVYLQMGHVKAASAAFAKAAASAKQPDRNPEIQLNRAFMALSADDYQVAIGYFEAVLIIDPNNIAAANNRSICWLYSCKLQKAISSLEDVVTRDPEHNLDEALIFNLCTLYDLASDRSAEKKKNIMALVAKYAPDSFDFRVLKINP